jgi:hypothetical protein
MSDYLRRTCEGYVSFCEGAISVNATTPRVVPFSRFSTGDFVDGDFIIDGGGGGLFAISDMFVII